MRAWTATCRRRKCPTPISSGCFENIQFPRPFRPALRACGRVTFFGCKKSNQKCALQAAAVRGASRRGQGLGVWHRASISDLLVRADWSLGLRVTNRYRLRWLSERSRLDCAGTCLSRMLKRVPVRGDEGWWWRGCGWCFCPVAGMVTLPEMSSRRGALAAIRAEFIGAGCASHGKNRHCPARKQGRKPPGADCRSREADRATQPTHHPELEPSSASTDDHNALDRGDPAPITIEAGIAFPPGSQSGT